jgi:MOSC domain-containing protein YiiM
MAAVERILVRADADGPSHDVERVRVVPGRGLEGDRYFTGDGTFSVEGKSGQDLTLIEAEALEALAAEHGIELEAGETGRNVLTRGVDLNALVGRRFRIGDLECYGDRPCDPCATLERHTQPGVMRGLAGRGGLRADLLTEGELVVGAQIRQLD